MKQLEPKRRLFTTDAMKQLEPKRRLFTTEDLHKMCDAGIFAEDEKIELIQGEVFTMVPPGGPHIGCVNRLTKLFVKSLDDSAEVSVQNPVD